MVAWKISKNVGSPQRVMLLGSEGDRSFHDDAVQENWHISFRSSKSEFLSSKDAPFPKAYFSTHKYETVLIYLGTNYDDPFDLGAEIEFYMGAEKEKHVFNQSTVIYIPPNMEYGPWEIKKISKPFNFLQVVMGAETPVKI